MSDASPAISALERYDATSRADRAERLLWLSQFQVEPFNVMGIPEVLDLREEARACYVNGHFVATLLTALACVEQMLSDELRPSPRTKKNRVDLEKLIKDARAANIVDSTTLDDAEKLREFRNAFSHQKDEIPSKPTEGDPQRFRLAHRMRKEMKHPRTLAQEDAQLALRTMYAIFQATLKSLPPA